MFGFGTLKALFGLSVSNLCRFFKTVFYAWEKSGVRRMGDGESCCRQNSFFWEDNLQLGNRGFYVPPSPVIGCHWSCVRGKRLHGPFPDFPGDFPPTAFCVYGVKTKTPRLAILKKKKKSTFIRFIKVSSNRRTFAALRQSRSRMTDRRSVSAFSMPSRTQQQWLFGAFVKMRKTRRLNQDFLPNKGKCCTCACVRASSPCLTASCFISHVN